MDKTYLDNIIKINKKINLSHKSDFLSILFYHCDELKKDPYTKRIQENLYNNRHNIYVELKNFYNNHFTVNIKYIDYNKRIKGDDYEYYYDDDFSGEEEYYVHFNRKKNMINFYDERDNYLSYDPINNISVSTFKNTFKNITNEITKKYFRDIYRIIKNFTIVKYITDMHKIITNIVSHDSDNETYDMSDLDINYLFDNNIYTSDINLVSKLIIKNQNILCQDMTMDIYKYLF